MAEHAGARRVKHRWRFFTTEQGNQPVKDYLAKLPLDDFVKVAAVMKDAQDTGTSEGRHLRGAIYELRISGRANDYRVLYATEGNHQEILLALVAFPKRSQKTPIGSIDLAEKRLHAWRRRGARQRRSADPRGRNG